MKRNLVSAALVAVAIATSVLPAAAQTSAAGVVQRNGYYFNGTTGQRTTSDGHVSTYDTNAPQEVSLDPTLIYTGTIAAGAADTTSIVDLSRYRTVALLVQVSGTSTNNWQRLAFHARYNLGGLSDSLSLFSLPVVVFDDSTSVSTAATRVTGTSAGAIGAGEFPVTIVRTNDGATSSTASIPQGKCVPLTIGGGARAWPSRCSFRIRNIGRTLANTPTIRVWVMGTAL